ncbi:MAG: S-ribosylhomocysteine lyase [Oscillospiraceae bacterium]|nr:S-ribosylhomocysteine lyase [Oscillospiraceae bacterium]
MKAIASFTIDHDILQKGMYVSRVDEDITTYDIRMVRPNCGNYIANAALHTFEHLFATYVRNSRFASHIIYVGPMGCRTGFYLLTRNLPKADVIALVQESFAFIAAFEGQIPGAQYSRECGNYKEHDLPAAKQVAADMRVVLKNWTIDMLDYNYHTQK